MTTAKTDLDKDFAFRFLHFAEHGRDERRLARADLTDDGHQLTLLHLQINAENTQRKKRKCTTWIIIHKLIQSKEIAYQKS